jgi:exodeoxyribonuclease-3
MTIICTWNVNSVKARLNHLEKFVSEVNPDVILLQELKCIEEQFPYEAVENLGYNIAVSAQKSYNGVAILSKSPLEDVIKVLPGDSEDEQARYIEAFTDINGHKIRLASVYVPNGQEVGSDKFRYKLSFFKRLQGHIKDLLSYKEKLIIGGDLNVAPEDIDVYNPKSLDGSVGFHPEERSCFRTIINTGVFDAYRLFNPDRQEFSWWDYRTSGWQHNKGMRIDHLLISPEVGDSLSKVWIESKPRGWERASDHTPVLLSLSND